MFPLTIQGQIECTTRSEEEARFVISRISSALASASASSIRRTENTVTFRGGIFRFITNWNILLPVSHGKITVCTTPRFTINYRLYCIELLVIATLMAFFAGFHIPGKGLVFEQENFLIASISWLILFGLNYLIAAFRLPAFIRRSAGV